jgi:hypothetical protein
MAVLLRFRLCLDHVCVFAMAGRNKCIVQGTYGEELEGINAVCDECMGRSWKE